MTLVCALRPAVVLCLWPALLGLDPGYYAHLLAGQARLLLNREPIGRMLHRRDLDPALRSRLLLVQDIRRFAVDQIGLSDSRSYASYSDTGEGPLSWQLTVSHADRLEPVTFGYPVVGRFPYKGYFDLGRAQRERDKWRRKGYDTHLRPVSAYSTLGWFDDPVLTSMLRYSDVDLAGLIIHELTHETIWIADDVGFNESLATFVGQTGSMLFLSDHHGHESDAVKRARDVRQDGQVFRTFMFLMAGELKRLYDSDRPRSQKLATRQTVFDSARSRFKRLPFRTGAYGSFGRAELNNARFIAYRTYHDETDVFERVHVALGRDLKRTLEVFRSCEGRRDPATHLETWLLSHAAGQTTPGPQ